MSRLGELIASGAPLGDVAAHLDALALADRIDALSRLSRSQQAALYERGAGAAALDLDYFAAGADSVDHVGANTLPLPRSLRRFEKRFARAGEQVFGYNEGRLRKLVGPGYFVARAAPPEERRGSVIVDYLQVPDGPVPAGWPRVVPNTRGLQRFVYGGTRDFMRRVSADVSIGAAFRDERKLGHYFTLVRR